MPNPRQLINFTKASIENIDPAPSGRRIAYNDTKIRGLQLIVTDRGTKSYYFYKRNHGKPFRDYLGSHPDLSVENARRKAQDSAGRAAMGANLRADKHTEKRKKITLMDAYTAYGISRATLKPSTRYQYERFMANPFADWASRPVVEITKDQISLRHRRLTDQHGPAYADGAMRFLRAVLTFARHAYEAPDGTPLLIDNPVSRLSHTRAWNRPKRRTTYLKPDQLRPWFDSVLKLKLNPERYEAVAAADWLLLMILTGLRRSEALQLRWADVDFTNRTLKVRDTKNHDDHTLPLSDYLYELLAARRPANPDVEHVFASYGRHGHLTDPRKLLAGVIADCGITFTPHDLRRTFATVADSLETSGYAIKRLLNHKSGSDVTAGYIMNDVDRLRKPMQMITDFMLKHAGLKVSATVAQLHLEQAS